MARTVGTPRKRIKRSQEVLDLVRRAKSLLAWAKQHRQSNREAKWSESERQYGGRPFDDLPNGDIVNVNMSFSTVNTIVPYITGADPNFVVEPYSGDATATNARIQQAMLNRMWRSNRMNGNAHLRRGAWDYIIYGDGYLKVSYTMDTVMKGGTTIEADVADLWVDRIDPHDMWVDPQADGLHNARWVIVRFYKSVEELQQDSRYRNTTDIEGGESIPPDDQRPSRQEINRSDHDRDKLVAVYEFYDTVARQLIVFTDQGDMPLQMIDDIDLPIVQLSNYPIPDSPYHMGELEQLRVLQQELDKTRTQMLQHRARNAQKWIARKAMLDANAVSALTSDTVNAVVEVLANDRPLNDVVAPLVSQPLLADVYAVDNIIKSDMYEISGANEYLRGATPEIRRSATEATIMEGASNIKVAHKLHQIEDAVRIVGQLLLDYAAAIFPLTDEDEMALILTGRDAQTVAAARGSQPLAAQPAIEKVAPTEDIFRGVYEVFVEQNSTELRNPIMREQKYRDLFTILVNTAPVLMQFGVQVNLREGLALWLKAAGVEDVDAILSAPQDANPMAQLMGGMPGAAAPEGVLPGQRAGQPNIGAAVPPMGMIGPENSGMFPPTS